MLEPHTASIADREKENDEMWMEVHGTLEQDCDDIDESIVTHVNAIPKLYYGFYSRQQALYTGRVFIRELLDHPGRFVEVTEINRNSPSIPSAWEDMEYVGLVGKLEAIDVNITGVAGSHVEDPASSVKQIFF